MEVTTQKVVAVLRSAGIELSREGSNGRTGGAGRGGFRTSGMLVKAATLGRKEIFVSQFCMTHEADASKLEECATALRAAGIEAKVTPFEVVVDRFQGEDADMMLSLIAPKKKRGAR